MISADNEAIALQVTQGSGQHTLRDPVEPSRQLGVSQCAGHAESMDNTEGPPVAGMGQYFPFQPVIIVIERVAGRPRVGNHHIEVQISERYHSCTFFSALTTRPTLASR